MMEPGRVSVVIPNYNYARYIGEAIDSVLAQTAANVEIIVVDDGSTDTSKEILGSYGERITAIFQQNAGVAAARNNGVGRGSGEFVAFLDADDAWLPEKLERQLDMMNADPAIGLVHTGTMNVDADGVEISRRIDGMSGDVSEDLLRIKEVILGGGSGLMVRRELFDEIDGFDERMSTSADWDLFYRCAERSSVGFVPEVLVKYRVHGSNMHSNIAAMESDMLIGYSNAFANGRHAAIRDECYANFYAMLSGSYFHSGEYVHSLAAGLKSFRHDPLGIFGRL